MRKYRTSGRPRLQCYSSRNRESRGKNCRRSTPSCYPKMLRIWVKLADPSVTCAPTNPDSKSVSFAECLFAGAAPANPNIRTNTKRKRLISSSRKPKSSSIYHYLWRTGPAGRAKNKYACTIIRSWCPTMMLSIETIAKQRLTHNKKSRSITRSTLDLLKCSSIDYTICLSF